jgi:uncharacterized NAD(P)/FAD-binding protein YdhS/phosphohistidine swiveling domain-containing protein
VFIVGAGLAGTATAIRLLRFAREPLEIVLLERRSEYRSAGVAYHRDGNPWDHVFNIQAGRMSVFREDVHDFVRWANLEADRRDWPAPWAEFEFAEQSPAPRRIFQDYLIDRLAEARREACPGVVLVEADGEAVDLGVCLAGVAVTVRQPPAIAVSALEAGPAPEPTVMFAEHVVLATGLELREPPFAAEVLTHPSFLRDPYSAVGIRKLVTLPAEATVAIVGSVLSAYDSAGLLLRQGHTGRIHLISRTGTMFRTYPGGHEHGVLQLPPPKALLEPYRNRAEFLARIRTEWERACSSVVRDHPEVHPVVVAERVGKAWEPYLPEAIERIPSAELRGLLDEFSTAIAALRVGAVEYTTAVIERAMHPADGPVKLVVGKVAGITPTESGRLVVSVATPAETHAIEADLVVSNFGRESDYSRVGQPLWRNLLRRGLAVPHERTGRGVEVDAQGALLTPDGEPVGPISTVGVLREGDEIVRNGRTGAFAFNLAAIKNHSIAVAARAIEQLELSEGILTDLMAQYQDYFSNTEEVADAGFEEAVVLEVRRLATRARGERELLDSRLDACIRSMGELPNFPMDASRRDRLVRAVVNRAAVERLTDVSVTPRQLRRQLGIANAEDPEDHLNGRRIQGFLLSGGTQSVLRGTCNRTRSPLEGSILVTPSLEAGQYEAIVAARAVVCGSGGLTGHMQSICRGRGIPVLRVDEADLADLVGEVTLHLESQSIVIDADAGAGNPTLDDLGSACAVIADLQDIRTINACGPNAKRVDSFFIREEFLCLAAGLRPLDSLDGGPAGIAAYGWAVADRLCTFVEALLPEQRLVLRLLDLRSDHAAGVTQLAPVAVEPNPELGLHGARWLLGSTAYRDALHAVLGSLRERLGDDAGRVHLSVPFLTDEVEFAQLRAHLDLPADVPLSAFIETPSAVHATTAICAAGASELFVGIKDLVQFYLAADRGNHLVADTYQTRHPAVMDGVRSVVEAARAAGTPVRVFALGSDLAHYLECLPTPDGYMMCTAELQQVILQSQP